jgi:hypothetical protein
MKIKFIFVYVQIRKNNLLFNSPFHMYPNSSLPRYYIYIFLGHYFFEKKYMKIKIYN